MRSNGTTFSRLKTFRLFHLHRCPGQPPSDRLLLWQLKIPGGQVVRSSGAQVVRWSSSKLFRCAGGLRCSGVQLISGEQLRGQEISDGSPDVRLWLRSDWGCLVHPQQIQPHLNYTCCYTSQRNSTLWTTLANAAQQSLGTCRPEVPNSRMMSQLTIMTIILMGTKMMSLMVMFYSRKLWKSPKEKKLKLMEHVIAHLYGYHICRH